MKLMDDFVAQTPCPNCGSLNLATVTQSPGGLRLAHPGAGYYDVSWTECQECWFSDEDVPLLLRQDFAAEALNPADDVYGVSATYAYAVAQYRVQSEER